MYLCASYVFILGLVALELLLTTLSLTCSYICKRGTKTIGHDKHAMDKKSDSIYYELSNADMMRGSVNMKKRVRHYGTTHKDLLR